MVGLFKKAQNTKGGSPFNLWINPWCTSNPKQFCSSGYVILHQKKKYIEWLEASCTKIRSGLHDGEVKPQSFLSLEKQQPQQKPVDTRGAKHPCPSPNFLLYFVFLLMATSTRKMLSRWTLKLSFLPLHILAWSVSGQEKVLKIYRGNLMKFKKTKDKSCLCSLKLNVATEDNPVSSRIHHMPIWFIGHDLLMS